MSSPTNLTDRITHLRDRKSKAIVDPNTYSGKAPKAVKTRTQRERRFATDYFMLVAYSLLGAAILSQIFLIVWLDVV